MCFKLFCWPGDKIEQGCRREQLVRCNAVECNVNLGFVILFQFLYFKL